MTKAELIKRLELYPDHFQVILQSDAEGNGYSPLYDLGGAVYIPITTWSGEIRATESELQIDKLNSVVLVPVN